MGLKSRAQRVGLCGHPSITWHRDLADNARSGSIVCFVDHKFVCVCLDWPLLTDYRLPVVTGGAVDLLGDRQ